MTLAEALEQVDLEPGKTYFCRVNGLSVQLRVSAAPKDEVPLSSTGITDDDVMMDAWCELPRPQAAGRVVPNLGRLPLPDVPEIPSEEGDQE